LQNDIIIVGGGITGLTLACALAQQTNLSIAILEAKNAGEAWSAAQYHHRVSAVTLASQRIFNAIGIWHDIKNKRISPFHAMQVWDAQDHDIQFASQEINESVLGFIIENNVLLTSLNEKIGQYPQISYIAPVQLSALHVTPNGIEILTQENKWHAKLAIAADGANSWLREQAGITVKVDDYDESAIVVNVHTEFPHDRIARQVFLTTGPLAFLPLADPYACSIVWTLPTHLAKQMMACNVEQFKKELAQAFACRLGMIKEIDSRHCFPIKKQQAERYISPKVALMGDAAHVVHPLAGQGLNMGLLDAACLTEVITQSISIRRDFSSYDQLRMYERWRRADNLILMKGLDTIKNIFANNTKSLQNLRHVGIKMLHGQSYIKNIFNQYAVGNRKNLPELARG
jgi:2-polyprenylphenol 6-hydroxylase